MQAAQDKLSNDLERPLEKSHKSSMQNTRCIDAIALGIHAHEKKARHDHYARTRPLTQRKMARVIFKEVAKR